MPGIIQSKAQQMTTEITIERRLSSARLRPGFLALLQGHSPEPGFYDLVQTIGGDGANEADLTAFMAGIRNPQNYEWAVGRACVEGYLHGCLDLFGFLHGEPVWIGSDTAATVED